MKKHFLLALEIFILAVLAISLSACGGEGEAGPGTIELTNSTLYTRDAYPSFNLNMEVESVGTDVTGAKKTFVLSYDIANQSNPLAQHIKMAGEGANGTIEFVVLGDQVMTVDPGSGCSIFPISAMEGQRPEDTIPRIDTLLTGEAKRIKTGVKVEGVVTDQYEITTANMTNPESSATPRVTKGSVYVARDGGYAARVEIDGKVNTGQNGFDPNIESQMNLTYTFIPVKNGSIKIEAPTECQDQLSGNGTFPQMKDATGLVYTQKGLYYEVNVTRDEALNFYRARMIEKGWSLTNDSDGASNTITTLEFTKGSENVAITVEIKGEGVSVAVVKK